MVKLVLDVPGEVSFDIQREGDHFSVLESPFLMAEGGEYIKAREMSEQQLKELFEDFLQRL